MKNFIFLTFLSLTLALSALFVQPQKTQAFWGVGDIVADPANITTNVTTTGETIWSTISKEVLEPLVKKIADKILDKLTKDTINWANGGFDGEPGFINNWDDFLKGTQHEVISAAFSSAQMAADKAAEASQLETQQCMENQGIFEPEPCDDQYLNDFEGCIYGLDPIEDEEEYNICEQTRDDQAFAYKLCLDQHNDFQKMLEEKCGVVIDPGNQAQNNYNIFTSGKANSARMVTTTVAQYGSQKLNGDELDAIINGEGESLSKLLGSQQKKEQFKTDITAGGWQGYVALADPHNYDAGVKGLVHSTLSKETASKVDKVVEDAQTPLKFLNKKECVEYGADGSCTREVTKTPGDLVGAKVKKSLEKDNDQASLANGLIGSLVKSIGDLTDGLIQVGFNKLTEAASSALFDRQDAHEFDEPSGGGGYQSGYDVLGINADLDPEEEGLGGPSGGGGKGWLGGENFIGGPEDQEMGNTTQVVINFQEGLMSNIKLLEEEQGYYDKVRDLLVNSTDILYEFDKCIPGPDYGWESRFNDAISTSSVDDEDGGNKGQQNLIALNEMKSMTSDPKVTIPGGVEMINRHEGILKTTQEESVKNKIRIDKIKNALLTLGYIRQTVLKAFNQQKGSANPDLVLFAEDWDALSDAKKQNALRYAYDNGYFVTFSVSSDNGEFDAAGALASKPEKAKNAVISAAWDVWRDQNDPKEKLELRESYFVTQNDFSNDDFISIAKTKKARLEKIINNSYDIALDCEVFKLYALGTDRSEIANEVFSSDTTEQKVFHLANAALAYNPGGSGEVTIGSGNVINVVLGGGIGNFFSGGREEYVFEWANVSHARNDATIKSFLESEYALQTDGLDSTRSLFSTFIMTDPEAISKSILGFPTEEDKEEYFNIYYPNDQVTHGFVGGGMFGHGTKFFPNVNQLSIKGMYSIDKMLGSANRVPTGFYTHLFCRLTTDMELVHVSGNGDKRGSQCWKPFASAKKIDYQLIASGINQ